MRMLTILILLAMGFTSHADGSDIIPRKDRVWTTSGVASRMIKALMAVNRPVPEYLKDLARAGQSGL